MVNLDFLQMSETPTLQGVDLNWQSGVSSMPQTGVPQTVQTDTFMTDWFGGKNQIGYIPTALAGASSVMSAYTGLQNFKLAEDQLNFQKDAFNKNWANQTKLTNAALRDRQAARYSANPNAYENPDDYMAKNKVG